MADPMGEDVLDANLSDSEGEDRLESSLQGVSEHQARGFQLPIKVSPSEKLKGDIKTLKLKGNRATELFKALQRIEHELQQSKKRLDERRQEYKVKRDAIKSEAMQELELKRHKKAVALYKNVFKLLSNTENDTKADALSLRDKAEEFRQQAERHSRLVNKMNLKAAELRQRSQSICLSEEMEQRKFEAKAKAHRQTAREQYEAAERLEHPTRETTTVTHNSASDPEGGSFMWNMVQRPVSYLQTLVTNVFTSKPDADALKKNAQRYNKEAKYWETQAKTIARNIKDVNFDLASAQNVIDRLSSDIQTLLVSVLGTGEYAAALSQNPGLESPRDRAVLLTGQAEVLFAASHDVEALESVEEGLQADPSYLQLYLVRGQIQAASTQSSPSDASDSFRRGLLLCDVNDLDGRVDFIKKILDLLGKLEETEQVRVLAGIAQPLQACWSRLVKVLCREEQWTTLRSLVLGPPYIQGSANELSARDWLSADPFKEQSKMQMAVATCFKILPVKNPPCLTRLLHYVENEKSKKPEVTEWATDLVLAILLQGGHLQTLLKSPTQTCYHVALRLSFLTGKLGLFRFIMSKEPEAKAAKDCVNQQGQTLLHTACILSKESPSSSFTKKVVKLLLDNKVDPIALDSERKRAVDYLSTSITCLEKATDIAQALKDLETSNSLKTGCQPCLRHSLEMKDSFKRYRNTGNDLSKRKKHLKAACGHAQQILQCAHSQCYSEIDVKKSREQMEQTFKTIADELDERWNETDVFSSFLIRLSEKHVKAILTRVCDMKKWKVLVGILSTVGQTADGKRKVAKALSLVRLIEEDRRTQEDKETLVKTLLDLGVPPPAASDPRARAAIQDATRRKEFGLILTLLQNKMDPQALAPKDRQEDFSPAHYALNLFLQNLTDFALFDEIRKNHDMLTTDYEGNTLFHLALQNDSVERSLQALTKLRKLGKILYTINDEQKMAVDYLRDIKDKRTDYLIKMSFDKIPPLTPAQWTEARNNLNQWFVKLVDAEKKKKKEKKALTAQQQLTNEESALKINNAAADETHLSTDKPNTEDSADELGLEGKPWRVVIDSSTLGLFHSKKVLPDVRKKIVQIIRRLADGERSANDTRPLHNAKPELALFEANITSACRLIWDVGIAPEAGGADTFSQVIRIWDIVLDHDKIYHAVKRAKNSLQGHAGDSRPVLLEKMKQAPCPPGLTRPEFYKVTTSEGPDVTQWLPPSTPNGAARQIVKYCTFTSQILHDFLRAVPLDTEYMFDVNSKEREVIELTEKGPILLVGRSGTGKTTCCLYRLWVHFLQYWTQARDLGWEPWWECRRWLTAQPSSNQARAMTPGAGYHKTADNSPSSTPDPPVPEILEWRLNTHFHQVFVTKNEVLCKQVSKHFQQLCQGDPVTRDHHRARCENSPLPANLQELSDDEFRFPVMLTTQQLWPLLDASLPGPLFFMRDGQCRPLAYWGQTAPKATTLLDDFSDDSDDDSDDKERTGSCSKSAGKSQHKRLVSYAVFAQAVWHRINKNNKVNFHPSLVWMEITSFIKGSYEALMSGKGFLDREAYLNFAKKQACNFTGNRHLVYDLFEAYQRYLQQYNMYDEMDVVSNLYRRLRAMLLTRSLPWTFHEIYVDETQDFTQAELFLLILMTGNEVANRMFFTGDTAQSVMRGVAFRFDDLKTLFHYARASLQLAVPSHLYQLTVNYRSHNGILKLASSVLDLLARLFPTSFDKLEPDQGYYGGPSPVVVQSASAADLIAMLRENKRSTTKIEFGAHQAILVVNDEARERLPKDVRKANRLTIYESKGLEFDDVLIYNFFKNSQATRSEWRVIISFLDGHVDKPENRNQFDEDEHRILCSELKLLYTAVTRARANVYFFDEDEEKREPMFSYFLSKGLIEFGQGTFAKESSPKEWEKLGDEYFTKEPNPNYREAANCYHNANNSFKQCIAVAQHRLEQARIAVGEAKTLAFQKAALLFLHSLVQASQLKETPQMLYQLGFSGAACLAKGSKHLQSAGVFEKLNEPSEAAKQYFKAGYRLAAVHCWQQSNNVQAALQCLVDAGHFDMALNMLQSFEDTIQDYRRRGERMPKELEQHKPGTEFTRCNLLLRQAAACHAANDTQAMDQALTQLSFDEQIAFLRQKTCFDRAAKLLSAAGKTAEASLILLQGGDLDGAIRCCQDGGDTEQEAWCLLHKARSLEHATNKALDAISRAKELFGDSRQGMNGLGECLLLEFQLTQKESSLSGALAAFMPANQLPNWAGVSECCQLMKVKSLDSQSSLRLEHGVAYTVQLVELLLQDKTASIGGEDWNQYRMCMMFFGLEVTDRNTLVFYPALNPRWCRLTGPRKTSKRVEVMTSDLKEIHTRLAVYLADRVGQWYSRLEHHYSARLRKETQCNAYKLGEKCTGHHHHGVWAASQAEKALTVLQDLLVLDNTVRPLFSLGVAAERIEDLKGKRWRSVETLLSFLFPPCLAACPVQVEPLLRNREVIAQVEAYVKHLWAEPCHEGQTRGSLLQRQCRSTDWLVRASLLKSLFDLDGPHDAFCHELCLELHKSMSRVWIKHSYDHALWTNRNGTQCMPLAQRHLEAVTLLLGIGGTFDPLEAVIKFTKFLKLLGDKRSATVWPDLNLLLFWMEVFATVALSLSLKMQSSQTACILPSSYVGNLSMVDMMLPVRQERQTLQTKLYELVVSNQQAKLQLVKDRLGVMVEFVCRAQCGLVRILDQKIGQSSDESLRQTALAHLERAVVLALVLLSNVCLGHLHAADTQAVLQAVDHLRTCQQQGANRSQRLHNLIRSSAQARSYEDVLSILSNVLDKMENQLQKYWWQWRNNCALQPVSFGKEHPASSNDMPGNENTLFSGGDEEVIGVQVHHHRGRREVVEDDDISAEDEASLRESVKTARTVRAVAQWRAYTAARRAARAQQQRAWHWQQCDVAAYLPPAAVTDLQCHACGVTFRPGADGRAASGGYSRHEVEIRAVTLAAKERHSKSWDHMIQVQEFEKFEEFCRNEAAKHLRNLGELFALVQVSERREWYEACPSQLQCVDEYHALRQTLRTAVCDCSWHCLEECRNRLEHLLHIVQERNLRTVLIDVFSRHQAKTSNDPSRPQYSLKNIADFLAT